MGAALFWAAVTLTGGFHTYRILSGAGGTVYREAIERDGCEPFGIREMTFARCPRFRLP